MVWYKSFLYQAAGWKTARRMVAKVGFHFGELFPRVGFIVTKPGDGQAGGGAVLQQAGDGGTVDQRRQAAVKMTRLSCHRFQSNEVRLWLSVLAYKPGESVAEAGAAEANRELVVDELAAMAG